MTRALTITDHLGLKLAALYDEPAAPAPHPLVILLHGFTGWKEEEHISTLAAELAEAGIAALRFDASGSGESEGTWAEHYRLSNYLVDVPDVLDYAKANLPIDPARVGIWGHSMGGLVALACAARMPGAFVAVCGCQPSGGGKNVSEEVDKQWRETGWNTLSNSHFPSIKLPYSYLEDRQKYNALEEVLKIKIPILLLSGTTDELVSASSVRKIFDAASEPKTYREFPAGHDYKNYPDKLAGFNSVALDFFKSHLAGQA